jgi:hypothetical protein
MVRTLLLVVVSVFALSSFSASMANAEDKPADTKKEKKAGKKTMKKDAAGNCCSGACNCKVPGAERCCSGQTCHDDGDCS